MKEVAESLNVIVVIGFLAIAVFAVVEFRSRQQFKKFL